MGVKSRCVEEGCREQAQPGDRFCDNHAPSASPRPSLFSHRCVATTQSGEPCKKAPMEGENLCVMHHPDHADTRERISSLGGKAATRRSPASVEIEGIKSDLRELAKDLREGEISPGIGTVIVQVYNALLRSIEQDRKIRELDELEARISELEARTEDRVAAA